MSNQRPGLTDGLLREYFADGFFIVERRENGKWVEVIKVPEEKVNRDE